MIVYLIGTKAQYIKMAPVVLETRSRRLPFRLVYTGQHSETFTDLQRNFGLDPPHLTLVGSAEATDRQSFAKWLWRAWRASRTAAARALFSEASAIVVHGDTASTLLGAYVARRYRRPLVHVEAGLRSYRYTHPFPEEAIRVLVSRFAAVHCCPDPTAMANLERSGVAGEKLLTSGNTLVDALRCAGWSARSEAPQGGYGVFSMHRHENLFSGDRLDKALSILAQISTVAPVRFVLHPVTQRRLEKRGHLEALRANPRIELVPRMDFFSFNKLLHGAAFVVTDGGSNQEECALLGIPCVLLRQATERQDGLGANVLLADMDAGRVLAFVRSALEQRRVSTSLPEASPSRIIVERLSRMLSAR